MAKKKTKVKKVAELEEDVVARQFVVQIREVLPDKKFHNSVTKYIGVKDAETIYELLEDKK